MTELSEGMAERLNVMLIESGPHAADLAAAELEAAGHRILRCHAPGAPPFPCVGVTDPDACPIAAGADVALLVRGRVRPRPTPFEAGVACAIRAGLPIVEDGPDILDPYSPWITARNHGHAAEACQAARRYA